MCNLSLVIINSFPWYIFAFVYITCCLCGFFLFAISSDEWAYGGREGWGISPSLLESIIQTIATGLWHLMRMNVLCTRIVVTHWKWDRYRCDTQLFKVESYLFANIQHDELTIFGIAKKNKRIAWVFRITLS